MIRLRDSQTKDLVYLAKNLIETVRILCFKDAIFIPADKSPYKPETPYIIKVNKTLEVEQQFATEADAIEYIASNILNNENN
jgi:hypothetical protein